MFITLDSVLLVEYELEQSQVGYFPTAHIVFSRSKLISISTNRKQQEQDKKQAKQEGAVLFPNYRFLSLSKQFNNKT